MAVQNTPDFFNEDDEDCDYSCRICLEPGERQDVIAPCVCRGSQKWVHRKCLNQWRTTREDKAFSKCTECTASYTLVARVNDSYKSTMMRRVKFYFLVFRDISTAFLLMQLLIIFLSSVVYISDSKYLVLLKYFHSDTHIRIFYYCCGITISLSALGMLYFSGFSGISSSDINSRSFHCCNDCGRGGICPCYCFDTPGLLCCYDCGGGGGLGVHRCCPLLLDTNGCACCTESSCVCCDSSVTSTLSAEMLPVIIVIIVIFALVGAVIAIFAGTIYIQKITLSHIYLLQKQGLANDYIVMDLDTNIDSDVERQMKSDNKKSIRSYNRNSNKKKNNNNYISNNNDDNDSIKNNENNDEEKHPFDINSNNNNSDNKNGNGNNNSTTNIFSDGSDIEGQQEKKNFLEEKQNINENENYSNNLKNNGDINNYNNSNNNHNHNNSDKDNICRNNNSDSKTKSNHSLSTNPPHNPSYNPSYHPSHNEYSNELDNKHSHTYNSKIYKTYSPNRNDMGMINDTFEYQNISTKDPTHTLYRPTHMAMSLTNAQKKELIDLGLL